MDRTGMVEINIFSKINPSKVNKITETDKIRLISELLEIQICKTDQFQESILAQKTKKALIQRS